MFRFQEFDYFLRNKKKETFWTIYNSAKWSDSRERVKLSGPKTWKDFLKQNFKKRRAEGKENWKRALGTARENLILTKKTSRQNEERKKEKDK